MKTASQPLSSRWRHSVLCALGATFLSLWAWTSGWRWGAVLDNAAHDAGFQLRRAHSPREVAEELPQSRDIVIVDLPHEIPRPLLAQLVGQLRKARVVALDLMLVDRASLLSSDERPLFHDEIARWKREDLLLSRAMKKANNVVIGAWPERAKAANPVIEWTRPALAFTRSAHGEAHLGVIPDAQDGLIRRARLWEGLPSGAGATNGQNALPSLSLQVAALSQRKTLAELTSKNERELWINFLGPRAVFERMSNTVVFERALNWCEPDDFKGKIVFVGETDFRSKDIFPTPIGDLPGVFLHAHATATLLDPNGAPREMSLWGVGLLTLSAALLLVVPLARWTFPVCAGVALVEAFVLALGVALAWARGSLVVPLSAPFLAVFLTYNGVALFEYARTRRTLRRVVGRTMLGRLLEAPAEPELGGQEAVATAFFCDLRGFSGWSQTRTPQQLITALNVYTATVVSCVEEFGGRPIDFFGDGVFVLFEGKEHARRGVEAAITVARALGNGSSTGLRAGVALHSGPMVIGLVGHRDHLKPGAVGETVNIAARVQTLSDECGFTVLMTRETLEMWRRDDPVRESGARALPIFCGAHPLKGFQKPFEVFGLEVSVVVSRNESVIK